MDSLSSSFCQIIDLNTLDLSAESRKDIDDAFREVARLEGIDRCRSYRVGEQLQKILSTLKKEAPEHATAVAKTIKQRRSLQDCLEIYRCFKGHLNLMPIIHFEVQRNVVRTRLRRRLAEDVIALAADGTEVSKAEFDQQVLAHHDGRAERPGDVNADASTTEDTTVGDIAQATETTAATNVVGIDVNPKPDIASQRDAIVKKCMSNIGVEVRRIDDFCREHAIVRKKWFHDIQKGADRLLNGLRDWSTEET